MGAFLAALPYIATAAGTIWSSVSGSRAASDASRAQGARDQILDNVVGNAESARDKWLNGQERRWRIGRIAELSGPGLTSEGQVSLEHILKGSQEAGRKLDRMRDPTAGQFLALDLQTAKNRGMLNMTDRMNKLAQLDREFAAVRSGDDASEQALNSAWKARAGVFDGDAGRSRAESTSAWGSVGQGMAGLADMLAKMRTDPNTSSTAPATPAPGTYMNQYTSTYTGQFSPATVSGPGPMTINKW